MPPLIRPTSLRLPSNDIERHATWLELFFDLIFVVILTELADRLFHHFTYIGTFQCCALFIPVMWTWASYTVFADRFDNNDFIHWIMTFVIMFAGIIMAIQIPTALEDGSTGFALGFLIAQTSVLFLYLRVLLSDSSQKRLITFYLIGFGSADLCWFISLFFNPPIKFYLWALGMVIYLIFPWIGRKRILSKAPLDTFYIPERFGLFTIIVLGQTIASVVLGLKSADWNIYSVIASVMSFILAIIIWGQYYRFNQVADYKCTLRSGQPYIYVHIPLIISLIIMGGCAQIFIAAPIIINEKFNIIFCFAAILYLTSFYLLQYLTIPRFKIRGVSLGCGITAILGLFLLFPLPPILTMTGLVIIFIVLFGIQFWLGYQLQQS